MAIYYFNLCHITRRKGQSAVARAAYMSCSRMRNERTGVLYNYTRKPGLVWQAVFLPDNAPRAWADRSVLWNAVEAKEKPLSAILQERSSLRCLLSFLHLHGSVC